jgi:hypothetical protein
VKPESLHVHILDRHRGIQTAKDSNELLDQVRPELTGITVII